MPLAESFNASPGYQAETMTLSMIQVFLYAICALVVGAFFSVWTIQRRHEIAVLRAIGASVRFLLRDGLAQAALCWSSLPPSDWPRVLASAPRCRRACRSPWNMGRW